MVIYMSTFYSVNNIKMRVNFQFMHTEAELNNIAAEFKDPNDLVKDCFSSVSLQCKIKQTAI